jgi:hypothetical protein
LIFDPGEGFRSTRQFGGLIFDPGEGFRSTRQFGGLVFDPGEGFRSTRQFGGLVFDPGVLAVTTMLGLGRAGLWSSRRPLRLDCDHLQWLREAPQLRPKLLSLL